MHVLLAEDDAILADGIARVLQAHGMVVAVVNHGLAVEAVVRGGETDVVVLDIGLPDIDGFEVLRRLRSRALSVPVLLLTSRDAIVDRVHGFELGADDYLVKPFATLELIARLKALVRRTAPRNADLQIGALRLDAVAKRAYIDAQPLDLSAREWAVLEYLMQQSDRVVSKQQIIDAILPWGEELTLNAVEVYVSRIRLKVAGARVMIRTIRGFGYMLESAGQ